MAICSKCHQDKHPSEFQRDVTRACGHRSACKDCSRGRIRLPARKKGVFPESYYAGNKKNTPVIRMAHDGGSAGVSTHSKVPLVEAGEYPCPEIPIFVEEEATARVVVGDDIELGPAGIAPVTPEQAHQAAPPGYAVKGVSTLFDGSGAVVQQWVKTRQEDIDRMAALEKAVQRITEPFKDFADPVAPPTHRNEDLLCALVLGDSHFGQYSWRPETGEDFDLEIAERNTFAAVDHLVSLSPPGSEALICQVGDYFHNDDSSNVTKRSGHQLDVDTRWPNVLSVGIRAMRRCIDRALEKHSRVRVVNALGNHDDHSAVMLSVCLSNFYAREPRVIVEPSVSEFNFVRHGLCLIGITHGHTMKPSQMKDVMAVDRARDWGETKHRHVYSGHVHHDELVELAGCSVEKVGTLAAKDKHAARSGYRAQRTMKCDWWHREHGRIVRHVVGVEQLEAKAA